MVTSGISHQTNSSNSRSLDPRSAADAQSTLQALGWKFPAPMAMAPDETSSHLNYLD